MAVCIKCKQDVQLSARHSGCVCAKLDEFFGNKPVEPVKVDSGGTDLKFIIRQIQGLK